MDLFKVFENILSGRAVVITGSGINGNVKNHEGKCFPTGRELAELLYEKCGIANPDNPYDLQDASQTFIEKKTSSQLITILKNVFNIAEVDEAVKVLYQLPWIRCYTTNYDEGPVIAGRKIPVTLSKPTQTYLDKEDICVYINGYIGELSEETLTSEFKLTSTSYDSTENILSISWGEVMRNDLELAETVIIIGLSLDYDLDIRRIFATQNIRGKIIFIEREGINEDKKRKLGRLGEVYDIGIDKFISQLNDYRNHVFVEKDEVRPLICFEKYAKVRPERRASSREIYNLFMTGEINKNLFWLDDGKYTRVIYRSEVSKVLDAVDEGKRIVFLHANLGNGKTFFLEFVKRRLSSKGVDVFSYLGDSNKREIKDIQTIATLKNRNVVIVENYFNHMDLIKNFGLFQNENTTFILTARTMIYDTKLPEACKELHAKTEDVAQVEINKLGANEINSCYNIFEKNQFWGDYSKYNQASKKALLRRKTNGNAELQSILIDIIHSSSMKNEIAKEVNVIREKAGPFFPGLVIMLMAKVMALEISVFDINRMLNTQCMDNPIYTNNEAVKELVQFSKEGKQEYRIKSSVIAKEILSNLCTNREIIDALLTIAKYANRYVEFEKYESMLQNVVSFSHVNSFLTGKRDNIVFIIDYYDSIKNLKYYEDNSFFWLQYSIACLKYSEYDLAQNYVAVAYAKFRESKYVFPFQCDNQQAKILLYKIINGKSINIREDFLRAHELAMKPCSSEKDREENVLRLFYSYVDKKMVRRMKSADLMKIYQESCGEAYNRVNDYLRNMRNERDRERYTIMARKLLEASVAEA